MISDQDSRDCARKRLDVNIVVEAGAGTGKTTLLTDRVLFLLLAGGPEGEGLPLSRVVALTFTEKAAGEIKTRLADRLGDLVSHLDGKKLPPARALWAAGWVAEARRDFGAAPEKIHAVAARALGELDRAPIGTLHGFCRTLLQLHPIEAGLSSLARVDPGPAFDRLFQEEWARWLETSLAENAPEKKRWTELLRHVGLGDLVGIAKEWCRRGLPDPTPGHSLAQVQEIRGRLERLRDDRPKPQRGKMLASIERVRARLRAVEDVLRDPEGPFPDAAKWEEKPKSWPKEWAALAGEEFYVDALDLANEVSPAGEAALGRARPLLRPFVERFRAAYRGAGWMGYDDLLRGARDLLAHSPTARRALKARFGALLVDEFQDTDPLQGETLLYLAEAADSEAASWREVLLAPGRLFIVGDPKQSIYRFRGADIRAYEAFVDVVMKQGGVRCDLRRSFRTHAGIVEPVNRLFGDIMRENPGLQPAYNPLLPRPADIAPVGRDNGVELVLVPGDKTATARDRQDLEARWVARWIVERCGPAGSDRPWRLGDVALLFRTTSPLPVYLDALKAARIPYLVESDRAFYGTPEVVDFLNLLKAIDTPGDAVSLVGLLRSPLVLLEDAALPLFQNAWDYRRDPPAGLSSAQRERVSALFQFLREAHARSIRMPLTAFVDGLLREGPFFPAMIAAYHGEQTAFNLFKLARLAGEETLSLAAVVRRLEEAVGRGQEEGESRLGEETIDAVRLTTIHKAKGLEYKVVILPNLAAHVGGKGREPAMLWDWSSGRAGHRWVNKKWADAGMALLEREEKHRAAEEAVRLFYVAATRAREHLVLMGAEDAHKESFLSLLKKGSHPAEDGRAWILADGLRLPVTRPTPGEDSPRWPDAAAPGRPALTPALESRWQGRWKEKERGEQPLYRSPSRTETGAGGAAPGPSDESPGGAALGSLCHAALEKWDYTSGPRLLKELPAAVARVAPEHPGEDWPRLLKSAEKILADFAASPAAALLRDSEILAREAPFLYAEGDTLVRGAVDLLVRREGRLVVVDFKTDRVAAGREVERAAAYATQGRDYRDAVRRALGEPCGFEVVFLRSGRAVPVGDRP